MRSLGLVLLAACATTPHPAAKGGPRGLRADEHLDLAARHDELARQDQRWPDVRSTGPGIAIVPWVRSWDPGADHARLAAVHRSQASELQAAYEEACGARPIEQVAVSPIARDGYGGWNTSTGVIIYLSARTGSADQLMADLKCHRAWMMLTATSGMDDCPLDLPGMKLDAHGDAEGITLSIVVPDNVVDELHRRTALELGHKER